MEKNRYGHILTENFQEAVGAWIKNYSKSRSFRLYRGNWKKNSRAFTEKL